MTSDGAGRAIQMTDPMQNVMSYAYDAGGNVVQTVSTELVLYNGSSATATESFTSVAFYDCLGRMTVTATHGADGNFASALAAANLYGDIYTDPASSTLFTMAGYDSRGNAALSVDADGNSIVSMFDGASRRVEVNQLQRLTGLGAIRLPGEPASSRVAADWSAPRASSTATAAWPH